MKINKRIANLLLDGKPRSMEQMAVDLGLELGQIRTAMGSLQKHCRVARLPSTFQLTPAGQTFAAKMPSESPQARAKRAALEAARTARAAQKAAEIEERASMSAADVTQSAIRTRPALQAAWRAMA